MTRRFRSVEKLVCLRGNGNSFLVEDLQRRFIAEPSLDEAHIWLTHFLKKQSYNFHNYFLSIITLGAETLAETIG